MGGKVEAMYALANMLKHNTNITYIEIDRVNSENLPVETWSHVFEGGLRYNNTINYLELTANCLKEAAVSLASALSVNSSITHLILAHDTVVDDCVVALAEALKINKTLKILNLFPPTNLTISQKSFTALCLALEINQTLTSLYFRKGEIDPFRLNSMLLVNKTLNFLYLCDCSINDQQFVTFSPSLTKNKH